MGTFWFILAFMVVLAFYAYCNIKLNSDYVICAEAGDSKTANPKELERASHYTTHKIIRDEDGNVVNSSNMIRIKVNGNCMRPYGINFGDELLVRKIGKDENLDSIIQKEDILLIYLFDKKCIRLGHLTILNMAHLKLIAS